MGSRARGWLLVFCLLLVACQEEPPLTPTPPPTQPPVLAPTATATQPAATATPPPPPLPTAPASVTQLVNVQERLQLTLPEAWQTQAVDAVDLRNRLTKLQQPAQGMDPVWVNRLLAAIDPASTALLAWDARAPTTALVVTMLPRHGLLLESYLARAQAALAQQPGVTLQTAQVDATLRADGRPVGVLHYHLPASPTEALAGWQVVLLDQSAEELLLLTFTTPVALFADQQPIFQEIVRDLAWK